MVEKGSLFHETAETEWRILDSHQQTLSFSDVHPVDITVRNLGVDVDVTTSFGDALKVKLKKPKVGDVEGDVIGGIQRKKILKDVSADFPAGSLTAIIGGSGSGKVRPRTSCLPVSCLNTILVDHPPQCPFPSYAGIKPQRYWKCAVQRIFRPSHRHERLCYTNGCAASIPDRPRNVALCGIPSSSIIHHFSAA